MGRRIYIISQDTEINDEVIKLAKLANCPEIVKGIPQALAGVVANDQLPLVYEETDVPAVEPVNLLAMINANTEQIMFLSKGLTGMKNEMDQIKADIQTIKAKVGISDVLAE